MTKSKSPKRSKIVSRSSTKKSKQSRRSSETDELILPRGYLSWTQYSLFKSNKAQYIAKYIDGEEYDLDNSGLRFGKTISELLDGTREAETESDHMVKIALTRYKESEYEVIAYLTSKRGTVKLLCRLDTFSSMDWMFREYKTGRVPWTMSKALKHGQITFYTLALYLIDLKKEIPQSHLDWIETVEEDGQVRMTGKIQSFKTTKSMVEVLEMANDIIKVACEIDALMRKKIALIL